MRFLLLQLLLLTQIANAQPFSQTDSVKGSNGPNRAMWDVLHYDLTIEPDFSTKTIKGKNIITFFDHGTKLMQIDLQQPMVLDSVLHGEIKLEFSRNGDAYTIMYMDTNSMYHYRVQPGIRKIELYFQGKPTIAKKAPWDGGWVWSKDASKNDWASVACQGNGASIWFPCKDLISDKADSGAILRIITPDHLFGVGNGSLISKEKTLTNKTQYNWKVKNPISAYNIIPYIGNYVSFSDTFEGAKGKLSMNYYVLPEHLQLAKQQFKQAHTTLLAFEKWFGPYPFYEDGFKLVEAPYLGMEHQSNIAYGNEFKNGYLGKDLSGTGVGLDWDFIIVHETAHEWFGNQLTVSDVAEMWIHEGFGTYAEVLFVEELKNKSDAYRYMQGMFRSIENKEPILGPLGVRYDVPYDMYPKGAVLVHSIRNILNDDVLFRNTLHKMFSSLSKNNVNTNEILEFWNQQTSQDFTYIFKQYLTTVEVPTLEWKLEDKVFCYRWTNVVESFDLPMDVMINKKTERIYPTTSWQKMPKVKSVGDFSKNFYVKFKRIS